MWLFALLVTAEAATCDRAGITAVLEALPQVGVDDQGMLAAAGLSEACPRAGAFTAAAAKLSQVPPELRRMVDAELALTDPRAWLSACPGGPSALATAMQAAPADGRALLWTSCGLSGKGWFDAAEWGGLGGPVVVPLVAGKLLADAGVAAADVRTLVRALAGLPHPRTRAPEPLLQFIEPLPYIPPPPVD